MSDQAQPIRKGASSSPLQLKNIEHPHDHDVLSGRGNFVNYHPGNEHFRALVRKHKVAYVACPKPQKSKFSRMIVDEIRSMDPPGRFLKQDDKTKTWYDIGDKKALDKTRQALREGAPELLQEIAGVEVDELKEQDGTVPHIRQDGIIPVEVGSIDNPQSVLPSIGATHTLENLQKELAQTYPAGTFEPNPMGAACPDLGAQILEAQAQLQILQSQLAMQQQQQEQQLLQQQLQQQPSETEQLNNSSAQPSAMGPPLKRNINREDSLKFKDLFPEKETLPPTSGRQQQQQQQNIPSKSGTNGKEPGESMGVSTAAMNTSAMSAMSFSVGDMTASEEESHLSAAFEDSVRISPAGENMTVPAKTRKDEKRDVSTNLPKIVNPYHRRAPKGAQQPQTGSSQAMASFDMSGISSFSESQTHLNLNASTMNMSFARDLDDSENKYDYSPGGNFQGKK